MKTLHFGIEMEMTGITREKAANLMAGFFGTGWGSHQDGAYDTWTATDDLGRTWKAMSDSSIQAQRKVGGRIESASTEYRTEVVSPILSYDDIPKLQELVRTLRKAGAMVNSSCGIHIHVGAEKFTPKTLRNLVNLMASKEDMIYHALQIDPIREGRYCRKTDDTFLKELNRKQPKTMEAFADVWYLQAPFGREYHYNSSRYHGLNLHATFTKGTVEFRLSTAPSTPGRSRHTSSSAWRWPIRPSRRRKPPPERRKRTTKNTPSGAGCCGWGSSETNSRPAGCTC